jgi:antitoxin HicB
MNRAFVYPVTLTPDRKAGGLVVKLPSFPEAVTQGESVADALDQAVDALEEAVAGRIRRGDPIPEPPAKSGRYAVALPAQMAAKASLHLAMLEARLNKTQLAQLLRCDHKEVRRLLDPLHPSKMPRLERMLAQLGKRLEVRMAPIANAGPLARGRRRPGARS